MVSLDTFKDKKYKVTYIIALVLSIFLLLVNIISFIQKNGFNADVAPLALGYIIGTLLAAGAIFLGIFYVGKFITDLIHRKKK
jgi:hypothetical protein